MIEGTAIVCCHVFRTERQVKLVIRHADGIWQMVCGETDHEVDCSDFEVVGLEHLTERQDDLTSLDLPKGWIAERVDQGWNRKPFEE